MSTAAQLVDHGDRRVLRARSPRTFTCRGGVGIGGCALNPLQDGANDQSQDNCLSRARSESCRRLHRCAKALFWGWGVLYRESTKILDRETGEVFYGEVPAGSVVVQGPLPFKETVCTSYLRRHSVKRVDEENTLENLDQRAFARLREPFHSL